MNRRTLLKAALAGAAAITFPNLHALAGPSRRLVIGTRTLDVNGRAATVYSLLGPDGQPGLTLDAGTDFDVLLESELSEETLIHWHGLTPPWVFDGVPDAPSPLLAAGEERAYRFPVGEAGTHWMHAHTLQEQNLLAAPLIVRQPGAADEQEVVVMLHDFSFTPAAELLARLKGPGGGMAMGHGAMGHGAMGHGAPATAMGHGMHGMAMDLNDIEYDAYLANDRTLDDPEVVRVGRGETVRLRIINAATATAFTLHLGALDGTLVAVDGQDIAPLAGRQFGATMGQRLDIRVTVPAEGGAFPLLALREGARQRTGIVLATAGATVDRVADLGDADGPVLDLALEARLRAARPLAAKPADRAFTVDLAGGMAGYEWGMPGAGAVRARRGERIEITMRNASMMAHPMHLHGHRFQVVGIDGQRFAGAVRDTVLVPPMRAVTIAVDADNPGRWAFHCHHLYHMASGMMAEFAYEGVA